ncbi:MAG: exodeoxyribonuclease VII large subunit [Candidatus Methanomethylophilaceae archaeon]|nr:exodeoxyribonuclease VII large subunit [Candidatus Methanomethylophilaceae archaeon]
MADPITVTQFDELVKRVLGNSRELCDVFVSGEISEFKRAPSGHLYFTLKDGQSTLKCNMWRSSAQTVTFTPEVGMKVTAFGSADFYAPYGQLNFIVRNLAQYGEGEQKKALEELTNKLLKEGLFEPERKRKLPKYPKVIGVVTSEAGAVIKDIINTARLQFPADILLAPANVQGEGADITMIHALQLLNSQNVDVIIIGRGGGSKEDLSAFNSEALVRAIAASKAPVISAVGHATDKSLTDRVADLYAETPTQAAMLAVLPMDQVRGELHGYEMRAGRALKGLIDRMRSRFAYPDSRLEQNSPMKYMERQRTLMEKLSMRMDSAIVSDIRGCRSSFDTADAKLRPSNAERMVNECGMRLDAVCTRADMAVRRILADRAQRTDALSMRLDSDNPYNVLRRGYSYISDDEGNTITSAASLSEGKMITVKMRDGRAKAQIKEVHRK